MNLKLLFVPIYLLSVTVLYTSCTSRNSFTKVPERMLTASNVKQLNGRYENRENTAKNCFRCSFWAQSLPFYRDSLVNWTKTIVELKIDDKFLHLALLSDTVLLKNSKFKYKFENGFVVFKANRLTGVPLLYYNYQTRKNRLTLDNANNIKIYVRGSSEGGILILIFGSPIVEDYNYLRVK